MGVDNHLIISAKAIEWNIMDARKIDHYSPLCQLFTADGARLWFLIKLIIDFGVDITNSGQFFLALDELEFFSDDPIASFAYLKRDMIFGMGLYDILDETDLFVFI